MTITVATRIPVPPARAFAVIADIERWPDRIADISRIEILSDDPVGPGTRFRETRTMHGRTAQQEMTVTEYTPPERLLLTADAHGMHYRMLHVLREVDGGTHLSLHFTATPATITARLIAPVARRLVGQSLQRTLQSDLDQLAAACTLVPATA